MTKEYADEKKEEKKKANLEEIKRFYIKKKNGIEIKKIKKKKVLNKSEITLTRH